MNELINIINEITKYGLNPNLEQSDKEKNLEKSLVALYAKYFKIKYGEWILYDPGLNKNTYILWLLPLLIFLAVGAILYKRFIFKK